MSLHVQQSGSLLMIRRRSFIAGIFGFVAGGNNASNGTQIGHGPHFHPSSTTAILSAYEKPITTVTSIV